MFTRTHFALTGDIDMMQCKFARTLSMKLRTRFSGVSTKSGRVAIAYWRISAAIMCISSFLGQACFTGARRKTRIRST